MACRSSVVRLAITTVSAWSRPCITAALKSSARLQYAPIYRSFSLSATQREKYFSEDHEWLSISSDKTKCKMGITTYASKALGDITWVELPNTNEVIAQGDTIGAVESVKAAADIYAPIAGEIVSVNSALEDKPALIANDPEGEGWIAEIKLDQGWEEDAGKLMDEAGYKNFTENAKEDN